MSPKPDSVRKAPGSFIRDAYGRGLVIGQKIGENPFKFGVVGASDLHGAQSISSEQDYIGSIAAIKTDPSKTLKASKEAGLKMLYYGSGNITGAWAEENTRESVYNALPQKGNFRDDRYETEIPIFPVAGIFPRCIERQGVDQEGIC